MRAAFRKRTGRATTILGVVVGCGISMLSAGAAPAGAQTTQTLTFPAPTGGSCSGVGLSKGITSPFYALGLPVYAWDGVPFLGLVDHPFGNQGLFGPSCGDLAHGSSEVGVPGSTQTSFTLGANGSIGATTTVHMNAMNPLMSLLGQSAILFAQTNQDVTVTPPVVAGDQSFSITVTYTVLSSSSVPPPGSSSWVESGAGTSLSYTSTAQAPSCNGQQTLADQIGTFTADAPGTYTATSEFSCLPGQTLTETQPLDVSFNVVQSGFFQAGPKSATYAGSIVAEPDSISVTVGS